MLYAVMGSGRVAPGRAKESALLDHCDHVVLEATARWRSPVVGGAQAVFEGDAQGRHVGESAGIPAIVKTVMLPLRVAYDIAGDRILAARPYL